MRADITHPDVAPLAESALIGATEWNNAHSIALPTHALGNLGSAVTIDLANGTVQTGTVTENVTITLPAIPADTTESLTLILTNAAAAGPFAITVEQPGPAVESGTADSGSSVGALNDATKSWTVDEWVGYFVRIVAGTGAGQTRVITQNYSAQLVVNPTNFDVAPDVTSEYEIFQYDPITWLHGEAPTLNDAATERNVLVFRGAAGEGWIGDGGSA